eukprot:SAG11_NODE_34018_length_274_cov_0.594286_1_plen_69_part_10
MVPVRSPTTVVPEQFSDSCSAVVQSVSPTWQRGETRPLLLPMMSSVLIFVWIVCLELCPVEVESSDFSG